jgi:hypothetical protein
MMQLGVIVDLVGIVVAYTKADDNDLIILG